MANLSYLLTLLVALCCSPRFLAAAEDGESVLHSEVSRANNQSLFWGPYKPNLYFGVRPRLPQGLWTGLMWGKVNDFESVRSSFRYTCEQHEGLAGYGWDEYDIRRGGVETIHDVANEVDITVSFVKVPGGAHGGSWAARIKGVPREGAPANLQTMLTYYIAQEGSGELEVKTEGEQTGFESDILLAGNSDTLGDYKLVITKGTGDHPTSDHELTDRRQPDKTTVRSAQIPDEVLWQAKAVVFKQLSDGISYIQNKYEPENSPPPFLVYQLENNPGKGNLHIVQKIFEGPFEFDVLFSSDSAGKDLTDADLTAQIKANSEAFNDKFSQIFELRAPFKDDKYKSFAKTMFSNLVGGIGYFNGYHLVDRSYAPEYEEESERFWEETAEARARKQEKLEGPYELFTSIPSRPFFPRGFLWDEGFHLIPIMEWDNDLALDIVKSWFNTMDDDGWIAREQILGPEPRSKVPEDFQVQYPHYANPPTLFLIIENFMNSLRKMNGSLPERKEILSFPETPLESAHLDFPELGETYLRSIYPQLRLHYDWFRKTQRGDIKSYDREAFSTKEAYRWRGRTETHCLTSGLDDYPRPQPPHPGELHVDLMSWVGFMAKSLMSIADALGMAEEVEEYKKTSHAIERNLNDLHWSEQEGCFCDATIDDFEEHTLVCHKGYISLFPFLLGLMKPEDPKLGRILDLIGDEDHLFSPYGLRSLSVKDEFYGTAENYWRSPIWININYLAIVQLHDLGAQDGPYKAKAADLYKRLRKNVVDTVYNSWVETGFAWEQYNPDTGKGQRTQHFTGWTSMVVKIMAMGDIPTASGGHIRDEL
ncbi:hypothetical protein jhhlp_002428 [Lomentospora prolificans]|uniref:Mannosyl-oligosaccharide glucosidase n=1 Tax=Lomentospora prolificans TaxID=41688 RepID=A0A2N3NE79_9PEZI|nr:hypothetical protein jhhlp_002428 [Lomentospora prolificans]